MSFEILHEKIEPGVFEIQEFCILLELSVRGVQCLRILTKWHIKRENGENLKPVLRDVFFASTYTVRLCQCQNNEFIRISLISNKKLQGKLWPIVRYFCMLICISAIHCVHEHKIQLAAWSNKALTYFGLHYSLVSCQCGLDLRVSLRYLENDIVMGQGFYLQLVPISPLSCLSLQYIFTWAPARIGAGTIIKSGLS